MIVTLALAVAAALLALLRGGSLDRLAETKFRAVWAVVISLAVQLGFDTWDPEWMTQRWALVIVLGSNVILGAFLVANFRLPGMTLAAIGTVLNIVVIGANGAMPVADPTIVDKAYRAGVDYGLKHEELTDDTILPWLSDVVPIPGIGLLLSLGDVVIALGIARLAYVRTAPPRAGRHSVRSMNDGAAPDPGDGG